MSAIYQPVGLRMQGKINGDTNSFEVVQYPLTTNNTVAIAHGDPVSLVAGSLVPLTANPTSGTLSANSPVGVAVGFEYNDPNRGFVCSDYLAANAVSSGLYTNIQVLVSSSPSARFTVQANGSVAATYLGGTIALAGFGAASQQFKTSRVYANASTLNSGAGATETLRIVGFDKSTGNAAGDAYTVLLVTWNAGIHQFSLAGAQ